MPSSTSNSESSRAFKYIVALLAMLAAGQVMLQSAATWVMGKYGRNEARWASERDRANALVHDGKGVLLIGSSVLNGVNEAQLQQQLPEWTIRRLVMVGTFYTDWEYSLRRMYREGVKPDYVVVAGLPFQIYGDTYRGDYLALHWIDRGDIPELARRRNLDLTATSNLLFASYNPFFAMRDDVRSAIRRNAIPGYPALVASTPDTRVYKAGELDTILGDRLVALQTLLASQGARLIVLRYPAPDMRQSLELVKSVAASRNIAYVSPVESTTVSDFVDVYHLSRRGAEKFTQALGPVLDDELKRSRRN